MRAALFAVSLVAALPASAATIPDVSPDKIVMVISKLDQMTAEKSWTKNPAYTRLFTKSFREDRDKMWSLNGNWLDADELTSHQGTDGVIITRVTGTEVNGDQAIVRFEYHEHEDGGKPNEFLPTRPATAILWREDGGWKLDEFETVYPKVEGDDGGPWGPHAFYKHHLNGFWACGAKECSDPEWIIKAFSYAVPACHDTDDNVKSDVACKTVNDIANKLRAHNYCYGKKGEAGYQMQWGECGPDSIPASVHVEDTEGH